MCSATKLWLTSLREDPEAERAEERGNVDHAKRFLNKQNIVDMKMKDQHEEELAGIKQECEMSGNNKDSNTRDNSVHENESEREEILGNVENGEFNNNEINGEKPQESECGQKILDSGREKSEELPNMEGFDEGERNGVSHGKKDSFAKGINAGGSSVPEKYVYYGFEENTEEDYDTDLEEEHDAPISFIDEQKEKYIAKCKKLGIPPTTTLLNSLTRSSLKLAHQGLGSSGIKAISVVLKTNTCITELDLRDNNIDDEGTRAIAKILRENLYIISVDLSVNNICNEGLEDLMVSVKNNRSIRNVILSYTGLKDRHAALVASVIRENISIETLILSHNEFSASGGVLIGQALSINGKISNLDLSWNHIRSEGAIAIAYALKNNTALMSLNLAWNGFADSGAEAISKAMLGNDALQELDLSYNRISEQGAISLGEMIKVNRTLVILKLNWNAIKSEGVTALVEGISTNENCRLKELQLNGVVITRTCKTELDNLLVSNKGLKMQVGGVTNSGAMATNMNKIRREIVEIIAAYLVKSRLRMLDLFNQWDKDKSLTLTRNEFRKGIKSCKIPITEMQMGLMLDWLDQDGNDEIEYNEFVAITEVE